MWEKVINRLLTVKSLVTLCLTGVFAYLACSGTVDGDKFITIFSVVITFLLGAKFQKIADRTILRKNGVITKKPADQMK